MPSHYTLDIYTFYGTENPLIEYQDFMDLRLFFEFDEKIHVIQDKKQVQYFQIIKKKIFELFKKEQNKIDFVLLAKNLSKLAQP